MINKKIDIDRNFLSFISIMNNEFLLVGVGGGPCGGCADYSLMIFDKNLNLVESFITYGPDGKSYEINENILDNNTTLLYHVCKQPDDFGPDDNQTPDTLTTYSMKFANGTFNKTQVSVTNAWCIAERP